MKKSLISVFNNFLKNLRMNKKYLMAKFFKKKKKYIFFQNNKIF